MHFSFLNRLVLTGALGALLSSTVQAAPQNKAADKAATPTTTPAPTPTPTPTTPPTTPPTSSPSSKDQFEPLPILSWQDEFALQSTVRQVLFNAYLPLLARPTVYRGVHNDAITNQMNDAAYQRPDVVKQLLRNQDDANAVTRGRGALQNGEIAALINKSDFRPEDLEVILTKAPRFDDLVVTVTRVQPLGDDHYRLDYSLRTTLKGAVSTYNFQSVDVQKKGNNWLLPTGIILELTKSQLVPVATTAADGDIFSMVLAPVTQLFSVLGL